MSHDKKTYFNLKEVAVDTLEIAECQLLMSLIGLRQEDIKKQLFPEINPIAWIFGHCASHMDAIQSIFTGKRYLTEEQRNFVRYGALKDEIEGGLPFSFRELVDKYQEISESFHKQINEYPVEKFGSVPDYEGARETLLQIIQRMAFHYMGHMGQITLIRRNIGNPGESFISAIAKEERDKIIQKWKEWWKEEREI